MSKYNEAQKRAIMKYEKAHLKRVVIKLNIDTDADIIAYLDTLESVQGEIKRMIRDEIKKK